MFAYETSLENFNRGRLKPSRVKVFQTKPPNSQTKRPFSVDLRRPKTTQQRTSSANKPHSAKLANTLRKSATSVRFEDTRSNFGTASRPDTIVGNYRDDETTTGYESDSENDELHFGDMFESIDFELEHSRTKSRFELIDSMSKSCLASLTTLALENQNMNKTFNRRQSATIRDSSRRSSSSTNQGRPNSAMQVVRNRVMTGSYTNQNGSTTPGARPSSVASIFSNVEDNSEIDPTATNRSERTALSYKTSTTGMYHHALTSGGGRRGKGAFESVKPCKRMESILNEDLAAVVNDLSRQCCDVLGPNLCGECIKNVKQFNNFIAYHNKHPDIDETAMTLYAIPLVQRMFPQFRRSEIKEKLASGEISQQLKLKVNRSKDIECFDQKVTNYLPEKYRRKRMRKQRIDAGKGVTKLDDQGIYYVEPFNPSKFFF